MLNKGSFVEVLVRRLSREIKTMHPIALRVAIESGRTAAIRRAMKTLPVCAFVAFMGGEQCRKIVTTALARLLLTFKACVRAYEQYDTYAMRSCILTIARSRAVTLEEHQWINMRLAANERPYLVVDQRSLERSKKRFYALLEEKSACNL